MTKPPLPSEGESRVKRLRTALMTIYSMAQLRSPNTDNPKATMMRIAEYCYLILNETRTPTTSKEKEDGTRPDGHFRFGNERRDWPDVMAEVSGVDRVDDKTRLAALNLSRQEGLNSEPSGIGGDNGLKPLTPSPMQELVEVCPTCGKPR